MLPDFACHPPPPSFPVFACSYPSTSLTHTQLALPRPFPIPCGISMLLTGTFPAFCGTFNNLQILGTTATGTAGIVIAKWCGYATLLFTNALVNNGNLSSKYSTIVTQRHLYVILFGSLPQICPCQKFYFGISNWKWLLLIKKHKH